MKRWLLSLGLIAVLVPPASGQWVFDNGPAILRDTNHPASPNYTAWYDFSVQTIYTPFYLSDPARITGIQYNAWWIRDEFPNPWIGYTGETLWSIWADNGGSRGTQRTSGLTAGTWGYGGGIGEPGYGPVGTCGSFLVQNCWQHDLDVGPFTLSPGTYWLGLQNGQTPDPYAEWYYLAPTFDGVAFRLGGDQLGSPVEVVPEPATLTLLATGIAGVMGLRRRRIHSG